MQSAVARLLPDGQRLHLQHGPIDLILSITPKNPDHRARAFDVAFERFQSILFELSADLPVLRKPLQDCLMHRLSPVSQRMCGAVRDERRHFITPMAAVAGAVADEVLEVVMGAFAVRTILVNNGGDIAFFVGKHESGRILISDLDGREQGLVELPVGRGGLATSGRGGRSLSLGIADSVTVISKNAAVADASATLIANEVDVPGHPNIRRKPAAELDPDSDLGARRVVTGCGPLAASETAAALAQGRSEAIYLLRKGRVSGAALFLNGQAETLEMPLCLPPKKVPLHA